MPSLLTAHINNRGRNRHTFSTDSLNCIKISTFCTLILAAVELEGFTHRLTISIPCTVNIPQGIAIWWQQYILMTLSYLQRMDVVFF